MGRFPAVPLECVGELMLFHDKTDWKGTSTHIQPGTSENTRVMQKTHIMITCGERVAPLHPKQAEQ